MVFAFQESLLSLIPCHARRFSLLLAICFSLLAGAAFSAETTPSLAAQFKGASIAITQRTTTSQDQERQYACSHFMPSKHQARLFLENAKVITGEERHHGYDIYHCEVSGIATTQRGEQIVFTITLGGTGYLVYPDGKAVILGCSKRCCKVAANACSG